MVGARIAIGRAEHEQQGGAGLEVNAGDACAAGNLPPGVLLGS